MSEKTEQATPGGWRSQFATLHRVFRGIPANILEKATFGLIMLLILVIPVEMIGRMCSWAGIYIKTYNALGICFKLTAFIWLGKRILVPEAFNRPQWTLCDAALLAMLGWSVLATLASPDPQVCFRGDMYRREGLTTYLLYACVYLLVRNCLRRENIRRILVCLVVSVCAVCALCCLCLSPLNDKLSHLLIILRSNLMHLGRCGIFENENHFSYILGITTVLAAGFYLVGNNGKMKQLYLCLYVLLIYTMIQNGTLGGYLAAGIGIGAYLVVACIRKDFPLRRALVLAILFAVVSWICSYSGGSVTTDIEIAIDSVVEPEVNTSSLRDRLIMWMDALKYIAQRPLLGYGPDGSGIVEFHVSGVVNDRPHNEYLQYAVYLGIPGLAMYLTALCGLLVRLLHRFRELSALCVIMACAVLTYCASAFVGNSMYYTTIYYVLILAMLVNESVDKYPETGDSTAG